MASSAQNIPIKANGLKGQVSNSFSASPPPTFHSPMSSYGSTQASRVTTGLFAKQLKPFATEDIKILLLENINQTGRDILATQGYQVDFLQSSLPEDELIARIRWGNISMQRMLPSATDLVLQ